MKPHPLMAHINERTGGDAPGSVSEAALLIKTRKQGDYDLPHWALAKARQGDYHTTMAYERELIKRGEIGPQETAMALIDGNTGRPVAEQFNPEGSGVYERYQAPIINSPMQNQDVPDEEDDGGSPDDQSAS